MKHHALPKFWKEYHGLPTDVQRLADESFERLKADPRHPSLHFKKVGRYWSVRVGAQYRALAVVDGDDVIWFWIGRHEEYDRLIRT